ncbi:uncharacterized protein LOC127095973 [Lathyrus oleraceus]|uniref:uncharacterized protein LOC127095973 n=1 Tax=Pisum sativum TaxID=3888 RepID=UPI0021CFFC98|nr:uncharacterized protein LOC127095973 [Pisum sativum]
MPPRTIPARAKGKGKGKEPVGTSQQLPDIPTNALDLLHPAIATEFEDSFKTRLVMKPHIFDKHDDIHLHLNDVVELLHAQRLGSFLSTKDEYHEDFICAFYAGLQYGRGYMFKCSIGVRTYTFEAADWETCFKCGVEGHRAVDCSKDSVTCFKCGKSGHRANQCGVGSSVTCYNCGEKGHISTKCDNPKKEQAKGKVFALSGAEATTDDRLIQGTCFINGTPLTAIIDTGATHSFISLDCAKRLNLILSDMRRSMVIDTPAMGSVSTSYVCLNCPLSIFGRDFGIDLVCLPLEQLDVILGMNWLEFNRVYINCFEKTIIFPEVGAKEDWFVSAKQVDESVQGGAELFMLLTTLDIREKRTIEELPIVCEFAEVFPEDISDLPSEREVEFSIDLIPGTSPVSMTPYRMSASELKELKNQLEDLLEKKFIRPSVSSWEHLQLFRRGVWPIINNVVAKNLSASSNAPVRLLAIYCSARGCQLSPLDENYAYLDNLFGPILEEILGNLARYARRASTALALGSLGHWGAFWFG